MADTPLSTVEKLYAAVQLTRPLLRNITARLEADLSGTGISVGQRAILEILLELKRATAPDITNALQVKRQYVGREIKELLHNGMLEATPNPNHKTSHFYNMTEKANIAIVNMRVRETENFGAFASCFTPEDIDAFYRVQVALNEALAKT